MRLRPSTEPNHLEQLRAALARAAAGNGGRDCHATAPRSAASPPAPPRGQRGWSRRSLLQRQERGRRIESRDGKIGVRPRHLARAGSAAFARRVVARSRLRAAARAPRRCQARPRRQRWNKLSVQRSAPLRPAGRARPGWRCSVEPAARRLRRDSGPAASAHARLRGPAAGPRRRAAHCHWTAAQPPPHRFRLREEPLPRGCEPRAEPPHEGPPRRTVGAVRRARDRRRPEPAGQPTLAASCHRGQRSDTASSGAERRAAAQTRGLPPPHPSRCHSDLGGAHTRTQAESEKVYSHWHCGRESNISEEISPDAKLF